MKRFSLNAPCPKCGSTLKDVRWIEKKVQACIGGEEFGTPERLVVKCRMCEFKDEFTPLDSQSDEDLRTGGV